MPKIGVEGSLTDVKQALQQKGYDIVDLKTPDDASNCDCCVVTGQDQNVMGMSSAGSPEGSVINARGLTADQVLQEVDSKIR